ncbi:unnamed protein product, partial [Owenia fusiformis]
DFPPCRKNFRTGRKMSQSYSQRVETRTNADGSQVKTTTTTYGDGRVETKTETIGGGGSFNGFSSGGGMTIVKPRAYGGGGGGVGGRVIKPTRPSSRYSKGWGSANIRQPPKNSTPMELEGTTYKEIKAQCLKEGRLFEDPDFPAVDSSIFYSRAPPRQFEWKRPTELCEDPKLFVGGASRMDIKQGELGDCWLLAAIASLTLNEKLLYRVVPKGQSFTEDYAGIFHFQFWQYGRWVDVIVDDRLPTYYDRLVFMHSEEKNEYWSALLEKAYAKLTGSYEALKGGSTSEAMVDFTGGVVEMYDFRKEVPANMFTILTKAMERGSLMGCSIEAKPGQLEAELPNGLIMGHAYSLTDARAVNIQTSRTSGVIPMVRVRNPWGNECEWKGAWSDKSPEWNYIPEDERQEMGLTFDSDGEFWMSFQDFTHNFQKIEICNLGPDALTEEESGGKKKWEATSQDGSWRKRVNAGGCRNFLDTFWTNPQYRVHVTDPDDDDDEDLGTILVALLQKERRKKRKEGLDLLTMGYSIYRLKDPDCGPLDLTFFKYNASCAKAPAFINMREVCGRHKLPPGHYCVMPSTFEPNQEGDFLLRIFSEKAAEAGEIDEETGIQDIDPPPKTDEDVAQDEALKSAFIGIAGEDMEIDAYELKDVLDKAFKREFNFDGFSNETCRSMVAMRDFDRSGKLGFDEFKELWADLRVWKGMFKKFDQDKSGHLNSYELRKCLNGAGFRISNSTFNGLVMRYCHKDGHIYFDDFILCAARLKTMFDIFKEMDPNKTGTAGFTLDAFVQTTMYS